MNALLVQFLVFGAFGVTAEIFFTSIGGFLRSVREGKPDYTLAGHSQLWVFFLYGSAAVVFPPVYAAISSLSLLFRLPIYGVGILLVELIAGFIIETITGKCPWEYTSGWRIRGHVRVDYLPFWMALGFAIEKVYLFLNTLR